MTSYREGYCRKCGEYSQGTFIDIPGLCTPCACKYGYMMDVTANDNHVKRIQPECHEALKLERIREEFVCGFNAGREAALQNRNSPGCACVIDDNGKLIKICRLHAEWAKK